MSFFKASFIGSAEHAVAEDCLFKHAEHNAEQNEKQNEGGEGYTVCHDMFWLSYSDISQPPIHTDTKTDTMLLFLLWNF